MPLPRPVALTIAGSDPSGGAGIQADLKTFHQFGVYGEAAITLLTVQNTRGVSRVEYVEAALVAGQIEAVISDIPPGAAKTGALGNGEIIQAVGEIAARFPFPLVIDPVMVSKHGAALIAPDAIEILTEVLLPHAFLITPNLHEASMLAGFAVTDLSSMRAAAQEILSFGPHAVLIKGGHLEGDAVDLLLYEGEFLEFKSPRIDTRQTHGTGCTYSAAITAALAAGLDLPAAVAAAKQFITEAIRTAPGLGSGSGPVNHHAPRDGFVS